MKALIQLNAIASIALLALFAPARSIATSAISTPIFNHFRGERLNPRSEPRCSFKVYSRIRFACGAEAAAVASPDYEYFALGLGISAAFDLAPTLCQALIQSDRALAT